MPRELREETAVITGGDQLLPMVSELLSMTADETLAKRLERACESCVRSYGSPYGERPVDLVEDMAGLASAVLPSKGSLRDLSSVSRIHGGTG